MSRKILLAGAAAVVLAALALAAAYFYIPGGGRPAFEEGDLRVLLNENGSMELTWPEAQPADPAVFSSVSYHLDVQSGESRLQRDYDSPGVLLEKFALPMEVRIRILAEGKNLLGLTRQVSGASLSASVQPAALSAPEAVGSPGPGTLTLRWKTAGAAPDFYEVFSMEDGGAVRAASTSGKELELKVGRREGDLLLPGYGQPLRISVRPGIQGEGYILCGPASNLISVERQDLLGDDLNLVFRETEPRMYTLEWDETRGEYYELQEWSEDGWSTLETFQPAESFSHSVGRLISGSQHRYQVAAKDRDGSVRSSEEVELWASISPLYATVWPVIDQPYYEGADKASAALGKIPGGTALCVLEEKGDWFQVRYKDQYGYVDSRFCMINLPEYVGDHCSYDITNSYRSVFKVHESPIALITDQVVSGFEYIQTPDKHFLVPYLYPCAKKLLSAAQAAEADGYRLKIYEAFRPNEATRFLYDTTAGQLELAALVYSYEDAEGAPLGQDEDPRVLDPVTGWEAGLEDGLLIDPETGEKISREDLALRQEEEAGTEGLDPDGGPLPGPEGQAPQPAGDIPFFTLPEEGEGGLDPAEVPQPEPQPAPQSDLPPEPQEGEPPEGEPQEGEPPEGEAQDGDGEEPEYETYFQIMTNNGRFNLGSFLARVTSAHNRGIALDLTLEKIDGGEELEMQSAIHDLSWYSAAYLNNDNAKLLETYMTATGMRGLSSEWWHFQDDETREAIGLTSYLYKGVNMGGWTRDDQGWRYRDEDGSFFRNITITVDGKRYTVDQDGYASE